MLGPTFDISCHRAGASVCTPTSPSGSKHAAHANHAARGELFDDAGDERAVPGDGVEVVVGRIWSDRPGRHVRITSDALERRSVEAEQRRAESIGVVQPDRRARCRGHR